MTCVLCLIVPLRDTLYLLYSQDALLNYYYEIPFCYRTCFSFAIKRMDIKLRHAFLGFVYGAVHISYVLLYPFRSLMSCTGTGVFV